MTSATDLKGISMPNVVAIATKRLTERLWKRLIDTGNNYPSAKPVPQVNSPLQWKNGNDVRGEIQASAAYGTSYYTMSYRPSNNRFDGDFRRIRVTVKDHPEWLVLTKAGYYATQFGGEKDF